MRVGIIGTGLIGASIGLACKARDWPVLGYDTNDSNAEEARAIGAIDRTATRDELYADCDVVVIATHLRATLAEVASLRTRAFRDEQLVIDIGSVKQPIALAAAEIAAFVPTHPMAGGERCGPGAARADVFEGRSWSYTPTSDLNRTERARSFIEGLGAKPFAVDAKRHDEIVALTSHLPQAIAYLFSTRAASVEGDRDVVDALCGPTARELLRLGRSSHDMWDEIFELNAENVQREAALMGEKLRDRRLSG